jgi:hypothetical protein
MAAGVNHYLKDGTVWKGSYHKMPNGKLHTNKNHTKTSKPLFHFGDLSNKAKVKARKRK